MTPVMEKTLIVVGSFVVKAAIMVGMSAMLALPVWWLWNYTMPQIFPGVQPIGYLIAWAFFILTGILFRNELKIDT